MRMTRLGGMERELEDTHRGVVEDHAVRLGRSLAAQVLASRSDDELPDPTRVRVAVSILWREPLVVVIVPAENGLDASGVQVVPERLDPRVVSDVPRREPRMMPVGDRAVG